VKLKLPHEIEACLSKDASLIRNWGVPCNNQVCRHTCLLIPFIYSKSTLFRLHNCVEILACIEKLRPRPLSLKNRYVRRILPCLIYTGFTATEWNIERTIYWLISLFL